MEKKHFKFYEPLSLEDKTIHNISIPIESKPKKGNLVFKSFCLIVAIFVVYWITSHRVLKFTFETYEVGTSEKHPREFLETYDDDPVEDNEIECTFKRYNLSYTQGHRVKGDKQIYFKQSMQFFNHPINFTFNIKYPRRPRVKTQVNITLIALHVVQTSRSGQAVIKNGGIGHSNVTIEVTSYNTTQFRYRVRVYGVKLPKRLY
uniref:CSON008075 protein n=1 Tax=Culicoides sonorensis TaxID=179676 RepID=A0A336LYH1_CULSO